MSFWIDDHPPAAYPKLEASLRCDTAVIGGGIAGLTAAYLLASAGRKVVVIDRGKIGGVDSSNTTAHLTMVTDERLSALEERLGRDHAQAVWDAGLAAIDQIDAIVQAEQIDCDFAWVPGYLYAAVNASADDVERLRRDASIARSMGFDAEFMDAVPFAGLPGVRFDGQARVHAGKYLHALAAAVVRKGGQVFQESGATAFHDEPRAVEVGSHRVTCDDIVMATHNPLVGNAGTLAATFLQTNLALYSSYVVAGTVKKGVVPDALFWDTGSPYHYLRLQPSAGKDLVVLGGEDHKTGQAGDTRECYAALESTLRHFVPEVKISHRWSGQVIETPDGLPYIGSQAPGQFTGTGFAGNGMTFGTLTGMMASDAIARRRNPWSELFALDRTRVLRAPWDYVKENSDYPYYMIRDLLKGGAATLRSLPRGDGRIVERDGKRVAAYRDSDGSLTLRSAICTHMGCVVGWNAAERTWDCPCHGSRFSPDGSVMSGPAEQPLEPVEG